MCSLFIIIAKKRFISQYADCYSFVVSNTYFQITIWKLRKYIFATHLPMYHLFAHMYLSMATRRRGKRHTLSEYLP